MIKHVLALSPLLALALPLTAEARPEDYAEGQVWQYAARPQDPGSLVKIQKIEVSDGRPVYHVSVVGVHLARRHAAGVLPHLPVSAETLDASVTRRVPALESFPDADADEGIAEWRAARGGVLTEPLAQVLDDVDAMLSRQP